MTGAKLFSISDISTNKSTGIFCHNFDSIFFISFFPPEKTSFINLSRAVPASFPPSCFKQRFKETQKVRSLL